MAAKHQSPADATLFDWALLAVIVAMGGSSFVLIRNAVETIPPAVVTVGRLWIGAIFLYVVMKQAGRSLPPLFEKTPNGQTLHIEWRWMMTISAISYVPPFFIFPWAQQFVDSGLAGIYMAFMPIWTVVLAYFFAGETLGLRKLIGFLLGFAGVVILMGPEVISDAGDTSFVAQAALLAATVFYASYAVMTRRAPPMRPRAFAAGTLLCAAIFATPFLLLIDLNIGNWTAASIASVVGLGLGPTGLVGVLLIIVIQRAGAGFMSLGNYMVPVWAVAAGAAIYHERLELSAFIALAVILVGVAVSQSAPRTAKPQSVGRSLPTMARSADKDQMKS